ncbi:hypothetical protein H0H92_005521 [Tricholoma furcatifolium]|nr:hypothetical protein H0H92_005521 [Tricholoma furcatifolium]
MGQYWLFFNIDNPLPVPTSPDGKYGEFFPARLDHDQDLLRALWRPNKGKKRVVVRSLNNVEGFAFPDQSTENFSLMTEILDMILAHLDDIVDLVSFMTTCQRYWEIGRRLLEKMIEHAAIVSWAGDRLGCFGDYAKLDDLPRGMLTDAEVQYIKSTDFESLWDSFSHLQRQRCFRYARCIENYWRRPGSDLFGKILSANFCVYQHLYRVLKELIEIDTIDIEDFLYGHLVFRNLTTKEYVRGTAIRAGRKQFRYLSFEHTLLIRTSWSSDPSMAMAYDGDLQVHRGVWAGHRFDVVDAERVEGEHAEDGWKDVSEAVINEVVEFREYD